MSDGKKFLTGAASRKATLEKEQEVVKETHENSKIWTNIRIVPKPIRLSYKYLLMQ